MLAAVSCSILHPSSTIHSLPVHTRLYVSMCLRQLWSAYYMYLYCLIIVPFIVSVWPAVGHSSSCLPDSHRISSFVSYPNVFMSVFAISLTIFCVSSCPVFISPVVLTLFIRVTESPSFWYFVQLLQCSVPSLRVCLGIYFLIFWISWFWPFSVLSPTLLLDCPSVLVFLCMTHFWTLFYELHQ